VFTVILLGRTINTATREHKCWKDIARQRNRLVSSDVKFIYTRKYKHKLQLFDFWGCSVFKTGTYMLESYFAMQRCNMPAVCLPVCLLSCVPVCVALRDWWSPGLNLIDGTSDQRAPNSPPPAMVSLPADQWSIRSTTYVQFAAVMPRMYVRHRIVNPTLICTTVRWTTK